MEIEELKITNDLYISKENDQQNFSKDILQQKQVLNQDSKKTTLQNSKDRYYRIPWRGGQILTIKITEEDRKYLRGRRKIQIEKEMLRNNPNFLKQIVFKNLKNQLQYQNFTQQSNENYEILKDKKKEYIQQFLIDDDFQNKQQQKREFIVEYCGEPKIQQEIKQNSITFTLQSQTLIQEDPKNDFCFNALKNKNIQGVLQGQGFSLSEAQDKFIPMVFLYSLNIQVNQVQRDFGILNSILY